MDTMTHDARGRKLLQWGYFYYNRTSRRWLYWAIPIIAVGVGVFVFAIVFYLYRRRRAHNMQNTMPYVQPQPTSAHGTPVTGWPDYSSQYHQDYSNFSSYPPAGQPGPSQGQDGKQNVEMGVLPPGYPSSGQQYGGYPR